MIKRWTGSIAGTALVFATPMAAASPKALSVAAAQGPQSAEPAPTPRTRGIPGGGIIAAVILAGVIGVGVLLFTQDDEADSN